MLSNRGVEAAKSQDIPWRFAPGGNDRYDKDSNPNGVIAFGMAENSLVHQELEDFVSQKLDAQIVQDKIPAEAFTYRYSTMGGPRFPAAMAAHMNEYFKPHSPVKSDNILTAAGLTAIHEMIGLALGDPGDGALVARPMYGRFELDFGNTAGLNIVYADMEGVDSFAPEIVEQYQKALEKSEARGVTIKVLMIVNPHNPLGLTGIGRCYPESTLRELMKFCQKNEIHMISDEVYALSVYDTGFDGPAFNSALSIDPEGLIDRDRLHTLYGLSKDFGSAGLRLGSLITQNATLKKAVAANVRFHNPSGMSIAVGIMILEDRKFVRSFIELARERLRDSRAYATQVLDKAGIKYEPGDDREREFELAQKLLDGGVGLHPCEEHNGTAGHFRLVFSSFDKDILVEGLRRLISVLGVHRQ
ncbi:related to 1-aminocyclopropane-1-carboxylate synthase [Phialocephala subalpina]|uniref:Related to 1-aminocyclopropane-1-carboxylate synthase n=1 Tax=Phialocephala subalpina TaxID=576137 RepID=A0A1L7WW60_9HELO|nr:related to 1-aminocyclopropane-1-carboxylate synthase [Phialocephala subalpina]